MKKQIYILALAVFLIGVVSAATFQLGDMSIGDFIAGDSTNATFNFNYTDDYDGLMNSSLILRVNMSSLEEHCPMSDCSVWKGDFSLLGEIKQYNYFWPFTQERIISLYCTEDDLVNFSIVNRGTLYSQENLENGTFYCYNKNNYLNTLELDKKDEVTLRLSSHQALYPGEYSMSVELLEMEPDTMPPQIELNIEKTLFGENDNIEVWLNVTDMYNIDYVEYEIVNPEDSDLYYNSGWIPAELNEGFYYGNFNMSEYSLNQSGSYWIGARACDVLGNCGTLW